MNNPPQDEVEVRVHPAHAPLISVVTVCFNALATLPRTCDSLFRQSFPDFEWIVVDGVSTDGSVEWLSQNRSRMAAYVSEQDRGIYDAMNKAVKLARGKWVFFLNADDRLADIDVLTDVAKVLTHTPSDVGVIYGDAIYTDGHKEWLRSFSWVNGSNLVYGDLCHQVVFARRELFESVGPFDLSLRYNADFDWLLRVLRHGNDMRYVRRKVAYFFKGGAHVKGAVACEAERFMVRYRYRSPLRWRLGNLALRLQLKLRRLRGESV